ncbi:MAG: hypothetical protein J6T01_00500 [Kiritimatiellae bacterium]|nr:hypothetical protein [Kiritimatiellia bacterium]
MDETTASETEKDAAEAAAKRLKLAELKAERAQAVMDSLAGFCHALGQPATVLLSSIELLRMPDVDKDTHDQILSMCYEAVIEIRSLLAEMKKKREYVAEAYLAGNDKAGNMLSMPEWSDKAPPKASWESH